jgi:hypothetical protein
MSRWPFLLVFGVVFLVVTGVLAWAWEELLFRWVGRRYRLKSKLVRMRNLVRVKSRRAVFIIEVVHVLGIGVAAFVGVIVGILAMALAIEVFE